MTEPDHDLLAAARIWADADPDDADRAEVEKLVAAAERGDAAATQDLHGRFTAPLRFGTAGLRGPMRAGPDGLNRATVRRAAAGLGVVLAQDRTGGEVIVGFDTRHASDRFAAEAAAVLAGTGFAARLLDAPVPTPLLAFAVRQRAARAGVMITASHNPAGDNGFKVYLGDGTGGAADGAQIAPPLDRHIEDAIEASGPARALPLGDVQPVSTAELREHYLAAVLPALHLDTQPRRLRIAYTPLHGVGGTVLPEALTRAGFAAPEVVSEQAAPDPDFPTVRYPNPEEDGALDLLEALVRSCDADLGLANDPDADRCAVLVRTREADGEGVRALTGDEIGCLLADAVLRRRAGPVATTVVSSSLLPALAERAGAPAHVTLTGFKYLMRAADDLVFAYEEALGYAVTPDLVRDKDGIGAAVLLAGLADELAREGRTLVDRLDDLAAALGVHATAAASVRMTPAAAAAALRRLADEPPADLAGLEVVGVGPLEADGLRAPLEAGLVLRLDGARVVLRPSGTEPKLKAYLEVTLPPDADVRGSRTRAADRLRELRAAATELVSDASGTADHASN